MDSQIQTIVDRAKSYGLADAQVDQEFIEKYTELVVEECESEIIALLGTGPTEAFDAGVLQAARVILKHFDIA